MSTFILDLSKDEKFVNTQKGLEIFTNIDTALKQSRPPTQVKEIMKVEKKNICKRCSKPTIEERSRIRTDGCVIIRAIHDSLDNPKSFCEYPLLLDDKPEPKMSVILPELEKSVDPLVQQIEDGITV
jgi:hypothetical protein